MTALPAIVGLVGSGISYMGQRSAANAAEAAAESNAQLAENNARNIEAEGRETNSRNRTEANRRMGALRARAAAGGTRLTGSSLDFLSESSSRLETRIQDFGRETATRALSVRHGGAQSRFEGQSQASALRTSAAGTLLTGLGSAVTSGYRTGALQFGKKSAPGG